MRTDHPLHAYPESSPQGTRSVLLHYHIFKNAGSTVDFVLQRNFGDNFATFHGDDFDSCLSSNDLVRFLSEHPKIRALSSHHLRPPKPEAEGLTIYEILILRHPVDRLVSMYDFYRRSLPLEDPLQAVAKEHGFPGFAEALIARYPHLINNPQVNCVACGGSKIPREPDLTRALRAIPKFFVVGNVEQLDLVLLTAECSSKPLFGPLDFSYRSQNVNPERIEDLERRLLRAQELCGSEMYERLLKLNRMDLVLLAAASDEAARRSKTIPQHDAALKAFQARCCRS